MPECSIRLKKEINICKLHQAFLKSHPLTVSVPFFLYLIMNLYVLFIYQLTCHFISFNIMRVLLKLIKCCFNWKALLHFPKQIIGRCTYFNKQSNIGLCNQKLLSPFLNWHFANSRSFWSCPSISLSQSWINWPSPRTMKLLIMD